MRLVRAGLFGSLALFVLAGFGLGLLYLRLSSGPLSVGPLAERLEVSLANRIGPGWAVALRDPSLELHNGALALHAGGLDIRDPEGALVLRAPQVLVSVASLSLLGAQVQPRAMEFRDLQLRAVLNSNGALSFSPIVEAAEGAAPNPAPPKPVPPAAAGGASPVAIAVASLFELLVGPSGLLGALDDAQVTNARLTLVDSEGRERATFRRVNAGFARTDDGGRSFSASLDGPGGVWHLEGRARPDAQGGFHGTLRGRDAPLQDILLLSGLSGLPATTNLKVSGEAQAVIADGRVTQLDARMETTSGIIQVDDKDTGPQQVDSIRLDAAWEEGRRALSLRTVAFKGQGTDLTLQGELVAPGEPGWRLALAGTKGVLGPLLPGDAPVALDRVEAQLTGRDGLSLDTFALRGPTVSVDLTGAYGAGGDPRSIKVQGRATNTAVRSVLRIWPEAVTPPIRRFLVANLRAGTAEVLDLKVAMSGADVAAGTSGGPIPDETVRVEFAIRDGELSATEGLPPLSGGTFTGVVTGLKASVAAPVARVALPDGRALGASAGSLSIANFWLDGATAQIGFKLDGGADALASLLQTPLLRDMAGIEADPATLKGRVDLRVQIPLAIHAVPKLADIPLTVTGSISDLSVEKVFGRDRLEGATLAVSYDRGALAIKGDGRFAGGPASVEVQQVRGQGGEAALSLVLDDAARARKGMTFGPQLTGPLPLKAVMPIGRPGKPGIRVEADLTRATIDGVIPGWTKAAGRPGKLTFTYVDGASIELRDLALDSAPVQLRGSAVVSADGQLDKADLSAFRLSQGDEMQAKLERTGNVYRVNVRGNIGDARPFSKLLGPTSAGGRGAREQRDQRELDLDIALNILTGFNDEAITKADLKASVRGGNLRQLQMTGRLGSSNLAAQTVAQAGQTVIAMQVDDAGAMLRFLDIYRRMEGGRMLLQMAAGDGPQAGSLTVNAFSLRNEAALRRIIPTQSQTATASDASGRPVSVNIDLNEVSFTKARADFVRSSGRLDFREAAIWGPAVGFTLDGFIDFARDRTDVTGTFVPAYGLNNMFAQVPLLGPLLGGGRNEGLFGVNFRLTGQVGSPQLTVNPLSAIAPGVFRKMFGTGSADPAAQAPVIQSDR
ncbi:MAG TPA: AsmA-like C-terminal region-containing protein [Microvirga sp.]|jgi:hypothetical protein|nr:AsmA-like C-terminal region-containing protein [Microvirga sp.]